jgi:hypothetical protein
MTSLTKRANKTEGEIKQRTLVHGRFDILLSGAI